MIASLIRKYFEYLDFRRAALPNIQHEYYVVSGSDAGADQSQQGAGRHTRTEHLHNATTLCNYILCGYGNVEVGLRGLLALPFGSISRSITFSTMHRGGVINDHAPLVE